MVRKGEVRVPELPLLPLVETYQHVWPVGAPHAVLAGVAIEMESIFWAVNVPFVAWTANE
jgi:hypothetical protein